MVVAGDIARSDIAGVVALDLVRVRLDPLLPLDFALTLELPLADELTLPLDIPLALDLLDAGKLAVALQLTLALDLRLLQLELALAL
jgi:hypothetical protein